MAVVAVKSTIEGITVHPLERGRGMGVKGSMIMGGLAIDHLLREEGQGLDQEKDGKDKDENRAASSHDSTILFVWTLLYARLNSILRFHFHFLTR